MTGTLGRTCIILNAKAGSDRRGEDADQVRAALARCELSATIKTLGPDGSLVDLAAQARDEGYDTVVAAGGDGTIAACATALEGSSAKMGILPLGTFNYFSRSLFIPELLDEAVQVLASGQTQPMRIGKINGQIFLNNCSLGAYPTALKEREDVYARWGRSRLASYWAMSKVLVQGQRPLRLTIHSDEGETSLKSPVLFAFNNAFQLEQTGLEGREHIADDKLVVVVAPDSGRLATLRHAAALILNRARRNLSYRMFTGRRVTIEMKTSSRVVAIDGERQRIDNPIVLETVPGALNVIVPPHMADAVR